MKIKIKILLIAISACTWNQVAVAHFDLPQTNSSETTGSNNQHLASTTDPSEDDAKVEEILTVFRYISHAQVQPRRPAVLAPQVPEAPVVERNFWLAATEWIRLNPQSVGLMVTTLAGVAAVYLVWDISLFLESVELAANSCRALGAELDPSLANECQDAFTMQSFAHQFSALSVPKVIFYSSLAQGVSSFVPLISLKMKELNQYNPNAWSTRISCFLDALPQPSIFDCITAYNFLQTGRSLLSLGIPLFSANERSLVPEVVGNFLSVLTHKGRNILYLTQASLSMKLTLFSMGPVAFFRRN